MKPLSTARLAFPLAAAIAALLAAPAASAAGPYYWDSNAGTAGFGNTAGTWGTSAFWSTVAAGTGATANTAIATSETVNFGTATLALGSTASAVGVGTVNAGNIVFGAGQSTAVVLSGGTITLGAASTVTVNNASDTIGSVLAGAATSLTKAGTGELILSGANTYTGTTLVTNGTLSLTGNRTVTPAGTGQSYDVGGTGIPLATLKLGGDLPLGTTQIRVGVNGPGTVTQTAGLVSFSGSSGNELTVGITASMPGIYNLSGGTLQTVAVANRGVVLGVNNNTTGTFNLSDTGTLTMASASVLAICRGDNVTATGATGIFNQTGGIATVGELRMGGNSSFAALGANSTASLNLSAGTFAAASFTHLSGGNTSSSSINISGTALVTLPAFPTTRGTSSTATITFDGGTLSPLAASATYMGGLTSAKMKAGGATFDVGNGKDITITQDLLTDGVSTGGGLTKSGVGILTLTGTNTYTGGTTVSDGKLVVNGNISTSTLTTVAVGATLGGSGTVGKTLINGTLAVGNSPGTMTFTDTLTLVGTTVMEIDGNAGAGVTGGHDFANLTGVGAAGVLTTGGTLTLDIGVIFTNGSYTWNLFDMASETGAFSTITLADQYSGSLLDANSDGVWDLTSGVNTWQFTESTGVLGLTVVPEPNAAALLGGFGLLALQRRRR